jgi:hypothetical protein
MQAVVNPGEAKQIEQDYAHATIASSEMAVATAQSTADTVQAFIQMLRERIQAARQQDKPSGAKEDQAEEAFDLPEESPEPIEIKMGREIVYRQGYPDKDPIDKLNPNKLKLLQAAVDTPQQQGTTATIHTKGTINIKAGDELVYRMSQGTVETNRLQPDQSNQSLTAQKDLDHAPSMTASAPVSEENTLPTPLTASPTPALAQPESLVQPLSETAIFPAEPASQPSALQAEPAPQLIQASETQPNPEQTSAKVVSILDVLERQNQQVVDNATRKWMQQTTRIMRRSSQQLTDRVVAIAANIRSRQIAATAVDLLQKYGVSELPNRGVYQPV